jgi:hypothetical protein
MQPERHASMNDPSTWTDYAAALTAVQAGNGDGISYVLTLDDPFAAIDLDHCRDAHTNSIDAWAQNFLDVARNSYSEVTPSGDGIRIWGLAAGAPVNRKFTLEIEGKMVGAELFRHTNKPLTITGSMLDPTIRELGNIDKVIDWAVIWGERRKAAADEAKVKAADGNGFNSTGSGYTVEEIDALIRDGVPPAPSGQSIRSGVFHTIVGHLLGCGWDAERISERLAQYPDGIGSKYIAEGRLRREVDRSLKRFQGEQLPLSGGNGGWVNGWEAKPELLPSSAEPDPELDDPELEEDELDPDYDPELADDDDVAPAINSGLPPLRKLGDQAGPLKTWLIKGLLPEIGVGLLGGRRSTGKTFTALDLAISVMTGQPFLHHMIKRQCGVLWFAAEGQDEVELRLRAALREKCGGLTDPPFRWYETAPPLLQKGSVDTLIAMAQQAEQSIQDEFGLPLGLVLVDTITSCAGYDRRGDENDNAVAAALMLALQTLARRLRCFVLGVAHLSDTGIRGGKSKEDLADIIWVCLGDHEFGAGPATNTRLVVEKNRGGRDGLMFHFMLRQLEEPEPDEDGDQVTTMVVDWVPSGAAGAAPPPPDPWLEGCRQEEQRVGASRLKRVLMTALAEHGVDRPIPFWSPTPVPNSTPPIESELGTPVGDQLNGPIPSPTPVPNSPPIGVSELGTPVGDRPMVRMVAQEVVREAFYLCTPDDPKQTQHNRFIRARDRAEHRGLIQAGNIDGVTYLWLTRPDPEDEPCD